MKRLRLAILLCVVLLLVAAETASASSCGGCVYRVRRGDSLWRIARRHGTTVQALVACNNIKNPRIIVKGQRIQVPCDGNGTCTCNTVYRVKRGDTLSEIAYWHGTTVKTLVRCNNISNPRLIHKGQRICIP